MKLLDMRVLGFQSFTDSGIISFSSGINLIVGQNNAGKSALLRALQPTLPDDRHRSPNAWEDIHLRLPEIRLTIELSGQEFRDAALRQGQCFIPVPQTEDIEGFINSIFSSKSMKVKVSHISNRRFQSSYPSHDIFQMQQNSNPICAVLNPQDGNFVIGSQAGQNDSIAEIFHQNWQRSMFYFSAERMNLGQSGFAHAARINSNAANLPAALLTLSGDRGDLFQKLVRHVREIFSTVGNISVGPIVNTSDIEIRIWPTEAMERVELSFPLLQSGTGVAQVLAILTAIMTIEDAVIIIDEINSFLHPAAVKSLLRIIQTEYNQHQYIISTHSTDVIGFSNPQSLHLVSRSGYESSIKRLDLKDISAFREVAEHLGVSMADIFSADRIVWVEGPTEELCFPVLYNQVTGQPLPRGTIFTAVMATGDFMAKRRDKEIVYQIYRRLSEVAVPLVVSTAFSFDSESLSDAEKAKMVQDSGGAMHFLPRRHIECYLVNAAAIAGFILAKDPDSIGAATVETVTKVLIELASSSKLKVSAWNGDLHDTVWLAQVDAANLIAETCSQISEHRCTFSKKDDTLALLQLVQTANSEQLNELAEYTRMLVQAVA